MKHKTIQQLRDILNNVLKRGRPKQLKKLQKAYHGKRLKMWWASYAQFENLQISELKEMEGVGNRMKGGHRHNGILNAFRRAARRSKNYRKSFRKRIKRGIPDCFVYWEDYANLRIS
jgi:hypothetical protein